MRVLSVASEVYPLVKTGGLADVAGALPPALAPLGIEMRTLVPGYPKVMAELRAGDTLHSFADLFGAAARLIGTTVAGLELIVLDAPALYDRPGGPYLDATGRDHDDNWRRFAALARAGADIAGGCLGDWIPAVLHAHDWQAGLAPAYLHYDALPCASVITIHNLAFQGRFGSEIFPALGLPPQAFTVAGVEYYGGTGYLKAGLALADAITTVSPTYAQEIRSPEFGMGLQGLIITRSGALSGIVNGIDTHVWDPQTDAHLAKTFSARNLRGRSLNRRAVEERFALDQDDAPLACVVSRLTDQKGMDLLAEVTGELVAMGGKLAVLGTGDPAIEARFVQAAALNPGRVGTVIGYEEPLAHLLQGGADAIIVPSRFEPCGLTQLCGLRYGCVPVVARTGGLADTVIDANTAALAAGVATGIQFAPGRADSLRAALARMTDLHARPADWTSLQRRGMRADVSWARSAARYADLYRGLAAPAKG